MKSQIRAAIDKRVRASVSDQTKRRASRCVHHEFCDVCGQEYWAPPKQKTCGSEACLERKIDTYWEKVKDASYYERPRQISPQSTLRGGKA